MKKNNRIILVFLLLFYLTGLKAEILNGKILEVNRKYNFVIINLGKEDGIKKGMVFMIYREKKLLGKVEVEEVFKEMSSCIVLPWFLEEEIKIDDGILKP